MKYIKTPIKYVGGKERYLDQLIPLFPKDRDIFIDLFTGSGVVAVNMADKFKTVIGNDSNRYIINLINAVKADPQGFITEVEGRVEEYNFSYSYKYGLEKYKEISSTADSGKCLSLYNKEPFKRLVEDFNKAITHAEDITFSIVVSYFILLTYGFTGGVRFNKQGLCNHTVGKCDLNKSIMDKYNSFSQALQAKNIKFICQDFKDVIHEGRINAFNTFIYADPPYVLTKAYINKAWNDGDLASLLFYLSRFHLMGGKFALSELISYGDKENKLLKDWIKEYDFKVHYIETDYKTCSHNKKDKKKETVEVFVTNY